MTAAVPWDAELYPVLFALPGTLIAVKRPLHPAGWLMLFIGTCFALNAFALQWLGSGHTFAGPALAWWAQRASAILVPAATLLLLLLPDGRLPSTSWRPLVTTVVTLQVVVVVAGSLVRGPVTTDQPAPPGVAGLQNPLGLLPEAWGDPLDTVVGAVLVLPFLLTLVAVADRLRLPLARERAALVLAGMAVFVLAVTLPDLLWTGARLPLHIIGTAVLTSTILVAVVRGHLLGQGASGPAVTTLDPGPCPPLSPREHEVMIYLAQGLTNAEIARVLVLSPITVRNHVSSILTKLDATNRTHAVVKFRGFDQAQ